MSFMLDEVVCYDKHATVDFLALTQPWLKDSNCNPFVDGFNPKKKLTKCDACRISNLDWVIDADDQVI